MTPKLRGLKHQFISVISYDSVVQEFRYSIVRALLCSMMSEASTGGYSEGLRAETVGRWLGIPFYFSICLLYMASMGFLRVRQSKVC